MTCIDRDHKQINVWFVDSGCSNNMTNTKSLFHMLDDKQKK